MAGGHEEYSDAEAEDWKDEFILDYGQRDAVLTKRCMKSGWAPGNGTVTFTIVQDNQVVSTRGADGKIVYRNTDQDTISVDLTEALGAERITNFQAFKSSVDQRKIMYTRVKNAIERDMDDKVLDELDGTTIEINAGDLPGGSGSAGFVLNHISARELISAFYANTVGGSGEITALLSKRAFLQLEGDEKIASRDYNTDMPLVRGFKPFRWANVLWMPYPRPVEGEDTDSAKCFMWDMNAMGWHAAGDPTLRVGFDDQNLYYFCNGQEWCATKQLLDEGVLEFLHDDTEAFV
jgi:transposase-like protein